MISFYLDSSAVDYSILIQKSAVRNNFQHDKEYLTTTPAFTTTTTTTATTTTKIKKKLPWCQGQGGDSRKQPGVPKLSLLHIKPGWKMLEKKDKVIEIFLTGKKRLTLEGFKMAKKIR